MTRDLETFGKDLEFGFLDQAIVSQRLFNPHLISNSAENTMLRALRHELRKSKEFVFSVAFVSPSALQLLKQEFLNFQGKGTILTSTYLAFNSPEVFRELANLDNIDVRIFDAGKNTAFHAKGYVFYQADNITAIIGSSNLTGSALLKNQEWNLKFSAKDDGDIVRQLEQEIQGQLLLSAPLSADWIQRYEEAFEALGGVARNTPRVIIPSIFADDLVVSDDQEIVPNQMQVEALAALEELRARGEQRGIIVSATGTGKTILSALDVRQVNPQRMLFIVHREQILDRAMQDYQRVLGCSEDAMGKLTGNFKQSDRRYVFATVQTLAQPQNLAEFRPQDFDYILIDEVHKAGAPTYKRLLEHFEPEFFLGMTATPERTDGINIFELFDYNVPYEIRLQEALEEEMLCPFHYYGVTDYVDSDGHSIDEASDLTKLVSPERINYVLEAIRKYGQAGRRIKGLIFCSSKAEAREVSQELNSRSLQGQNLRTLALTSDDSIEDREEAVQWLEAGDLDYLVTVDIFNEGIDIPSVNQVVMLRQTKSSIIFTQQLGRGLRKDHGKESLIVIDFIGNYAKNFLIPIALFGDNSLSKDSIRRKIINSDESGTIAGVSSVSFDEIARERVFRAIAQTKLDSMGRLKEAFGILKGRLGVAPTLLDFARFDTVDPVLIASREGNYYQFLIKMKEGVPPLSAEANSLLTFLTLELLNGKRPHELLLLEKLLDQGEVKVDDYASSLRSAGAPSDGAVIDSVLRILKLEFFREADQVKYGSNQIISKTDDRITFSRSFLDALLEDEFAQQVRDIVDAGLFVSRHRYQWSTALTVGEIYSRKDVCRLLNWESNQQSVIYGYKVHKETQTCPIFITYHKDDDVVQSLNYGDEFIDPSNLTWFTRSRRTLRSAEVNAIVNNVPVIHVFAKKDDADGIDFYYLGTAQSSEAQETRMQGNDEELLPVVRMRLELSGPLESSLYEYLITSLGQKVTTVSQNPIAIS